MTCCDLSPVTLNDVCLSLAVASRHFVMIELVPGDLTAFMLGINAAPDTLAALRAELGLDANPAVQYVRWFLAC